MHFRNLPRAAFLISLALLAGCGPDPNSKEPTERVDAANRINDQATLVRLARSDADSRVRRAACARLNDAAALEEIAATEPDGEIRALALSRVRDEMQLSRLARAASHEDVRMAAAARLTNQDVLAKLAIEGEGGRPVVQTALERLKDEPALARVALESTSTATSRAALRKLTNRELIEDVARGGGCALLRLAALRQLHDWEEIAKFAKQEENPSIGVAAARMLEDQRWLGHLAQEATLEAVRVTAIERLTDQSLLADLARSRTKRNGAAVRRAAVVRVTDQAVLGTIALSEDDDSIRALAVRRLNDQTALKHLVLSLLSSGWASVPCDPGGLVDATIKSLTDMVVLKGLSEGKYHTSVREAATFRMADLIHQLTDQRLLVECVRDSKERRLRVAATEALNDQDTLRQLATDDADVGISSIAVDRITELQVLEVIAREDLRQPVRDRARVRIATLKSDQAALANIALNDPEEEARWLAVASLSDQEALLRVAMSEKNEDLRWPAIERISDPSWLDKIPQSTMDDDERWRLERQKFELLCRSDPGAISRIALNGSDSYFRECAVDKLDDEVVLATVALKDAMVHVRHAAAGKLPDGALLSGDISAWATVQSEKHRLTEDFVALGVDAPQLLRRYDSVGGTVSKLARAGLVMHDRIVAGRMPGLRVTLEYRAQHQGYVPANAPAGTIPFNSLSGEEVRIKVTNSTLSWSEEYISQFPGVVSGSRSRFSEFVSLDTPFIPAPVDVPGVCRAVLSHGQFTSGDLASLAASAEVPELRTAAAELIRSP